MQVLEISLQGHSDENGIASQLKDHQSPDLCLNLNLFSNATTSQKNDFLAILAHIASQKRIQEVNIELHANNRWIRWPSFPSDTEFARKTAQLVPRWARIKLQHEGGMDNELGQAFQEALFLEGHKSWLIKLEVVLDATSLPIFSAELAYCEHLEVRLKQLNQLEACELAEQLMRNPSITSLCLGFCSWQDDDDFSGSSVLANYLRQELTLERLDISLRVPLGSSDSAVPQAMNRLVQSASKRMGRVGLKLLLEPNHQIFMNNLFEPKWSRLTHLTMDMLDMPNRRRLWDIGPNCKAWFLHQMEANTSLETFELNQNSHRPFDRQFYLSLKGYCIRNKIRKAAALQNHSKVNIATLIKVVCDLEDCRTTMQADGGLEMVHIWYYLLAKWPHLIAESRHENPLV